MNYLIGAGGHGQVILGICELNQLQIDAFLDNKMASLKVHGLLCIHPDKFVLTRDDRVLIAIGDNAARKSISSSLTCGFFSAIHPSAIIDATAKVEEGTAVMAAAVINANVAIGKHVIINTSSVIEHDCVIGDYAHISPNATLCGKVQVGEGSHVGAGAVVIPGVRIGSGSVIGAGSVVTRNVPDHSLVFGNPARFIRELDKF